MCSGFPRRHTWNDAMLICNNLKFADIKWRLPTKEELESLLDNSNRNMLIDLNYFPNTEKAGYWSSSPYAPFKYWKVDFEIGFVFPNVQEVGGYVRCIGKPSKFLDNGNGTIADKSLHLIWQKCSVGHEDEDKCYGNPTRHTWKEAIKICNKLKLGNKKWRLPTKDQINSLIDTETYPPIDINYFPNAYQSPDSLSYWLSGNNPLYTSYVWLVDFYFGYLNFRSDDIKNYVRCIANP